MGNTANYKLAQRRRMKRDSLFILRCCILIYRNVVFLFTDLLHSYLPKVL